MEIERKFLIDKNKANEIIKKAQNKSEIEQFYVKFGDEEERFRKRDSKFFHTIKRKIDNGLKREEIESEITKEEYETNLIDRIGQFVRKTRYEVVFFDLVFEIDFYKESLQGLCVCEIEFKSESQAKSFVPPSFLGREITDDIKYKNQMLAKV